MPKCTKCGKKFQTLSALNDHYKAVHPNERFVAPKTSSSRNLLVGLVVVIIVVGALVGVLIYYNSSHGQTTTSSATITTSSQFLNQPINSTLDSELSGVSLSTLASVGKGTASTSGLSRESGSPLTLNGKPEILYIGGDYCPYCAMERWALAVALSKFGTLSGIEYMISRATDGNISTLTFSSVNYTSNYIAFQPVEIYDRSGNALQSLTQAEQNLLTAYDSASNAIPFVDIYNQYVLVGAQYDLTPSISSNIFTGLSWSQIGSQLNTPSSNIAQAVDGSANYLISMICAVDKDQPASICGQSFAQLSAAILPPTSVQPGGPLSIGVPVVVSPRVSRLVSMTWL